jgi:hypothetical protein
MANHQPSAISHQPSTINTYPGSTPRRKFLIFEKSILAS